MLRWAIATGIAVCGLCASMPAHAAHVSCGQTITTSTTLDSDLACGGQTALVVDGDDVTLDLGGHVVAASGTVSFGIRNTGGSDRTVIRNGVVRGFDTAAVAIVGDDAVVEAVTLEDNGKGLRLSARRATVQNNRFEHNESAASIHHDDKSQGHSVFRSNVIVGEGAQWSSGIDIFSTTGNVIAENTMSGIQQGINILNAAAGTRIEENDIKLPDAQDGWGMVLFADELVSNNEIIGNTIEGGGLGIWHSLTGTGSRIAGNTIVGSAIGILWEVTSPDMRIEDNVVEDAGLHGIMHDWIGGSPRPNHRTVVARNRVTGSGTDGILVEENPGEVRVEDNLVRGSGDDGIEVGPDPFAEDPDPTQPVRIAGNSTWDNGDWGIIASSPASDGGANRAWSNGRPAQCLNIVCGPGPPAALSLSPESATNTVGDEHCVTATVTDPDGRATPGVTVRFAVDPSDASGAEVTDAGGNAQFCYDGPVAPRTDEIFAYADADANDAPDAGEPGATASKSWVLPDSSARCAVMGVGSLVASNGDAATFRMNVHVHKHRSRGSLFYEDQGPAESLVVRASRLSSITCAGGNASIFGRTHGSAPLAFRIDVADGPDTYRIRTSDGYDSGERPLTSGNIRVH